MANLKAIISKAQAVQTRSESLPSSETVLPLERLVERLDGDTRPLNPTHVESLAESIAAIGLIEPLVLDNQNRLLAGGHRRAAIERLKDINPEAFGKWFRDGKIPVRILGFDASDNPELALQIEIAENEQRRDYTPSEVRAVAEKLKAAGYRSTVGRPKRGEKALKPALSVIFGKSLRTVERYLEEKDEEEIPPVDGISPNPYLLKALRNLQSWEKSCQNPTEAEAALLKKLPAFVKAIEKAVSPLA